METKVPARAGGHAGAARSRTWSADSPPTSPVETKLGRRSRLPPDASSQTTTSVSLTRRPVVVLSLDKADTAKSEPLEQAVQRIVFLSITQPEGARMEAVHDAIAAQLESSDAVRQHALRERLLDVWMRRASGADATMDMDAFTDAVWTLAATMGGDAMSPEHRAWWYSRLVAMAGNQPALMTGLTFWSVAEGMGGQDIPARHVSELLLTLGDCACVLEPGEMGVICSALAAAVGGADIPGERGREVMRVLLEEPRFATEAVGYMAWGLAKATADEDPLADTPGRLMLSGEVGAVVTRVLELADAVSPAQAARLVLGVATALEAEGSKARECGALRLAKDKREEWWRTDPGYLQRTNPLGPVDKPHRVRPVRESKQSAARVRVGGKGGPPDGPALLLEQLLQAPDGFGPFHVFAMACGLATAVGSRSVALCAQLPEDEGGHAAQWIEMVRLGLRSACNPQQLLDEPGLPQAQQLALLDVAYGVEGVLNARSAPRQLQALQARPAAQREPATQLLLRHGHAYLKVDLPALRQPVSS